MKTVRFARVFLYIFCFFCFALKLLYFGYKREEMVKRIRSRNLQVHVQSRQAGSIKSKFEMHVAFEHCGCSVCFNFHKLFITKK